MHEIEYLNTKRKDFGLTKGLGDVRILTIYLTKSKLIVDYERDINDQESKYINKIEIDYKPEDLNQDLLKYEFDFTKVGDQLLKFHTFKKGQSYKVIDGYFKDIQKVEQELKRDLEQAKKDNADIEELKTYKQSALTYIKYFRSCMSQVASINKDVIKGTEELLSLCEKQNKKDNKEEEK
jgi:hypothetical protein